LRSARLQSLVKIYENMKPKDAARIFDQLDMDVLLDVVERMKEARVAPILALVNPQRAQDITIQLAERRKLPIAKQ
jgi:flagellar motility protein MotE (MotC chaperone)